MYRMMIIDDEPIVRSGLKVLLPWEELGFEICAEGFDGRDGLKKVLLHMPELVLVDIKMPGLSGLELIEEARKKGFSGKFIILTGYSDFEFARKAITFDVNDYLLKPIDEEELLESLQNIIKELKAEKGRKEYHGRNEFKARQEAIRNIILNTSCHDEIENDLQHYDLDFHYHRYCAGIMKRNDIGMIGNMNQLGDDNADAQALLMLKGLACTERLMLSEGCFAVIAKGEACDRLEKGMLEAADRLKKLYNVGYFVTIGQEVVQWEDIHFSYECAVYLQEHAFVADNEGFLNISYLINQEKPQDEINAEDMLAVIGPGGSEEKELFLKKLKSELAYHYVETDIKARLLKLIMQVQLKLQEEYQVRREELPDITRLGTSFRYTRSLDELICIISEYIGKISSAASFSMSVNIIKRVTRYMEHHYWENLKLEEIAKLFGYNNAYLGKLFKKETGESFNNALDAIRIDNAKRLLAEPDLTVAQVSERVGYNNLDYFYTKFKKRTGVSAKEYQKKR